MGDARSEKHEYARNTLPERLKPAFDELVEHYKFAATRFHGRPYISYIVLAELIRLGWRCVEGAAAERE